MSLLLPLVGAVPALIGMAFFVWLDRKRPEPRRTLLRVAMWGALAALPVILAQIILGLLGPHPSGYWHSFYTAFISAALTEESAKLFIIWLIVWKRPEFDERMDGIVYGAFAGLGFALVENILYLARSLDSGDFVVVFIMRAISAVPVHAVFAAIMGYYAARKRFDGLGPGMAGGLLIAVILHGLYDFGIFAMVHSAVIGNDLGVALCFAMPGLVVIGSGIWLIRVVRAAMKADAADEARAKEPVS